MSDEGGPDQSGSAVPPDSPSQPGAAEQAPRGRHATASGSSASANRTGIVVLVVAVVVLAGAGIALAVSSGSKSPVPKKASAPEIPATTPTTAAPLSDSATCPLSGLPAPGGSVPQRPAIAMKVDNYPQARPQTGIDKADIVFEEPVEGGITRYVAVFQCQNATLVGPIRSASEVDVQIVDELSDPLFIHVGGIPPVLTLIKDANDHNEDLFYDGAIVQNVPGRVAPYDQYVSTAAVWGLAPHDTTPPAPLFTYSATVPAGTPTASVHIPYSGTSNATWTWDAGTGKWGLAYSGSSDFLSDGNQIAVTNIVIQKVNVTYGPWTENSEGALEVESQLTGSGPLTVLRNGVAITGTWSRSSLSSPTSLVSSTGAAIALAPGETWVALVPSAIAVTTAAS
jgi:Protein of unknown function (DUF3048) N-terminal domain/Protein of unknown function (DUF3048) C-terminal domain